MTEAAGEIQLIDGMKAVASPLGAPLPEGVPPWAFRCEIVEERDRVAAWQPWILGASIAVIVAGMIATDRGYNMAFAPVPLACVVAWLYRRPKGTGSTTVLRPAADGRYLAFDEREPKDEPADPRDRASSLVVGILMLGLAGVILVSGDRSDWYAVGGLCSFGIGMVYYGATGWDLASRQPRIPPSTEQFRALADPRRPLSTGESASSITGKELT